MSSFALFSAAEKEQIKPLCIKAIAASHPDRHQNSPESHRITSFLTRMTRELIDSTYVPASTLRELAASAPLGSIPLGEEKVDVNLDRGCNPFDLASLRQAILEISKDVARVLGNDTVPFQEMKEVKIEKDRAEYAQAVDYRYALNWIYELLDKDWYGSLDLFQHAEKNFSGVVMIRQILGDVFGLEISGWSPEQQWGDPWQVTHAKNALRALEYLIRQNLMAKNPYSSSGNFNFPYSSLPEVLKELGYSESAIEALKTKRRLIFNQARITDQEIIWILLTFSEGQWDHAAAALSLAKDQKKQYGLPDDLFDYAINHEPDPCYFGSAVAQMEDARKKALLTEFPKTVQKDGLTKILSQTEKAAMAFDEYQTGPILDPEPYRKYLKPFLRYTRQYLALQEIAKFKTGETAAAQLGQNTAGNALATSGQSKALALDTTAVEREVLSEMEIKMQQIEILNPGFLQRYFIPDLEEIAALVRSKAQGMKVYSELNKMLPWFEAIRQNLETLKTLPALDYQVLIRKSGLNPAEQEYVNLFGKIENSARAILKTIYPEKKKLTMGLDLINVEDDLDEALERMAEFGPGFLKANGFPHQAAAIKAIIKSRHGLDYGEKLETFVRRTNYQASNFQTAKEQPDYKRSKSYQRDIDLYLQQMKELLGIA